MSSSTTPLTATAKSLLVAAYFRGAEPHPEYWTSNSDQILTLSLFYTGDISFEECTERFARRPYVGKLYDDNGELTSEIESRYKALRELLEEHPEWIEGGGDMETPADPTFTACALTEAGLEVAATLIGAFPKKPDFPDWPDKRL